MSISQLSWSRLFSRPALAPRPTLSSQRGRKGSLIIVVTTALLSAGTSGALAGGDPLGAPAVTVPTGSAWTLITGKTRVAADVQTLLTARFGPQSLVGTDGEGRVHALRRLNLATAGDHVDAAQRFFEANRDLFGLDGSQAAQVTLALLKQQALRGDDGAVLQFAVHVAGVPLDRHSATARFAGDGRLVDFRMDPIPARFHASGARLSLGAIQTHVKTRFGVTEVGAPTLVFVAVGPDEGHLAYRVPVALIPLVSHYVVWVDASDGSIVAQSRSGFDQPHTPLRPVDQR